MANTNVREVYNAVGAEAVLTERADLRYYLTSFESSFGYVLIDKNSAYFYTDPRYFEGAKTALKGSDVEVKLYKGPLTDILKPYKEIALPLSTTYYNDYKKLSDAGFAICDSEAAFKKAMAVKKPYELDYIKKACELTDKSFLSLLPSIKEGMTENEVAAELEYLMRKNGASGTSFQTIVAFGENSSIPHHETGFRKLKFGDIILIDYGCKVGGYCSDCTRTFLFGDDKKHSRFKQTYEYVFNAHMLVKENLRENMTGKEADAIARNYFKELGLDKFFTHSLGHGIGVNIHEFPYLSTKSEDILLNGYVFSDEPGLYFEGDFGIRIEDTVTLSGGKAVSLTNSDKKLIIL